jgi:hypothetical protein
MITGYGVAELLLDEPPEGLLDIARCPTTPPPASTSCSSSAPHAP